MVSLVVFHKYYFHGFNHPGLGFDLGVPGVRGESILFNGVNNSGVRSFAQILVEGAYEVLLDRQLGRADPPACVGGSRCCCGRVAVARRARWPRRVVRQLPA